MASSSRQWTAGGAAVDRGPQAIFHSELKQQGTEVEDIPIPPKYYPERVHWARRVFGFRTHVGLRIEEKVVKKMFRRLYHKYHPDKCGGEITVAMRMHLMFERIKEAYQVLMMSPHDEAAKREQCWERMGMCRTIKGWKKKKRRGRERRERNGGGTKVHLNPKAREKDDTGPGAGPSMWSRRQRNRQERDRKRSRAPTRSLSRSQQRSPMRMETADEEDLCAEAMRAEETRLEVADKDDQCADANPDDDEVEEADYNFESDERSSAEDGVASPELEEPPVAQLPQAPASVTKLSDSCPLAQRNMPTAAPATAPWAQIPLYDSEEQDRLSGNAERLARVASRFCRWGNSEAGDNELTEAAIASEPSLSESEASDDHATSHSSCSYSDARELVAEAKATDNAQPAARPTQEAPITLETVAVDFLSALEEIAAAGNKAADSVLYNLHATMGGFAIKRREDVLDALVQIQRRRLLVINHVARDKGCDEPSERQWTTLQWVDWLQRMPLDEGIMTEAIKAWKQDFAESRDFKNRTRWRDLQNRNTAGSTHAANRMLTGAWKVELMRICGRYQLAIALLKHPLAAVHTLLASWKDYMESDVCSRQKERAKRYRVEYPMPDIRKRRRCPDG